MLKTDSPFSILQRSPDRRIKYSRCSAVLIVIALAGLLFACGSPASSDPGGRAPEGMVWVAGGTFTMGTQDGGPRGDSDPEHPVTISGFYMGKYEVTQEQYKEVMGDNPSRITTAKGHPPASGEVDAKRPVETVNWYDALVFCNKLSMDEGLIPAYSIEGKTDPNEWGSVPSASNATWDGAKCNWNANGYRLPTEAEWEYAARGGAGSPGNFLYSGSDTLDDVAWHMGNRGEERSHEVGKKKPNKLGLYDMSGNIYEWCWDWYDEEYYASSPAQDPRGASSGSMRIQRGGAWEYGVANLSTYRGEFFPYSRGWVVGFRVVRSRI